MPEPVRRQHGKIVAQRIAICPARVPIHPRRRSRQLGARAVQMQLIPSRRNLFCCRPDSLIVRAPARYVPNIDVLIFPAVENANIVPRRPAYRVPCQIHISRAVPVCLRCRRQSAGLVNHIVSYGIMHAIVHRICRCINHISIAAHAEAMVRLLVQYVKPGGCIPRYLDVVPPRAACRLQDFGRIPGRCTLCDRARIPVPGHKVNRVSATAALSVHVQIKILHQHPVSFAQKLLHDHWTDVHRVDRAGAQFRAVICKVSVLFDG